MSYQGQFDHILDRLYERRTAWLRTVLAKARPGRPRSLSRRKRERKIRELQELVSKAQAKKLARQSFKKFNAERRTWRVKGRGVAAKKELFMVWVRDRIPRRRGKVYVFWRGRHCQYVGRSRGKGSRPKKHFERRWFRRTTRVDVYLVRRKSAIPLLECLAIHRFLPRYNKMKAAKQNWTSKCPLCRLHRDIKTELRQIFRFR